MPSDLYNQMNSFNPNSFLQQLNQLKSKGGDPNKMIQELLNSGKVSQAQVNNAVSKAQQIMRMLPTSVRR